MRKCKILLLRIVFMLYNCSKDEFATPKERRNVQSLTLKAAGSFDVVNCADSRNNFVNGVLYTSGLSSSDTYSSGLSISLLVPNASSLTNLRRWWGM